MSKKVFILVLLCSLIFISCSGENKDWKNAESERSIAAYEDYLQRYPRGKFAEEGLSRIEALQYEKAESTNTIEAYSDFLKRYAKGEFADKARSRVEAIHFDAAKTANSIEAYQGFLERYPQGDVAAQARKMLEEIFPSFSTERVLEIESVSAVVGTGEISFTEGRAPDSLKITINVSAPVVDGKTCLGCGTLVRIAPNLKVPIEPFFTPMKQQGQSVSFKNMVLEGPTSADVTEFIVSGPEGATLKKEGNGFRLVEGEARFLKKSK
ncbi:MAG: hypothetical protein WBC70_01170 [Candidatus Aminicenantales bacterium]